MVADFKNFDTAIFDHVKVKGMYEWQLKPIELIVNVSFSVIPTSKEDTLAFNDELKSQLSLFAIDRAVQSLKTEGWKFDGSRYTYGHDYSQVRQNDRVSSLGVDLYFIQTNEAESIEDFYQSISKKIAGLKVFKPSEHFVIRPNRKNVKNKSE